MTRLITAVVLCSVGAAASPMAQEKLTEHTYRRAAGASMPPATIAEMAWLEGHWVAEALGGESEEIWSSPKGGAMMGMFRLVRGGKPAFYEILTLVEHQGSLVLRLKHFNADLTGWEEKDETVDFPLVAAREGAVHFEGMSFHPAGDRLTVYLAMRQKDGSYTEATFPYRRATPRH